jgi:predicted CoA-substrate-specific enzyme activase
VERTFFAGVDVGSTTTKAVIVNESGAIVGREVHRSGASFSRAATAALADALSQAGLGQRDITYTMGTGYGRNSIAVDGTRTEIACHARGAYHHFRRAITVVDIGGQDSKVIELDGRGRRQRFAMNRKCAAGTGAFVEEMAHRLDVPLGELSDLARSSTTTLTLNSFCTVFAATEVLARIRDGVGVSDLARAVFRSVARRVMESDTLAGELVLTGGVVAHHPVLVEIFSEVTGGAPPSVPPEPQMTGALGAALLAQEQRDAAPDTPSKKGAV